jgi:Glyoxalase/Bleomycin resistance protein/Dioxygenase superfamily
MSSAAEVKALDHVLVLSDDIERSREFYEGALGLRAGPRPPLEFDGFWLYAGGPRQLFCFDPDGARIEINIPANDPKA